MANKEYWTDEQEDQDYQVAEGYLGFTYSSEEARELVTRMRAAPIVYHYAANVLRVAALPALGESNIHVVRVLDDLHAGKLLSPVLIVRGAGGARLNFTIADGYFRICASNYLDELANIPCRMVPKEAPKPPEEPQPAKPAPEPAKPIPEPAKPIPEPAKPIPEPAKPIGDAGLTRMRRRPGL